jgi:hypothetical protein
MYKTIGVLCLTGALAWAQDPVKVAGGQYRVIVENEDVRLLAVDIAPGAKTAMHSHPDVMAVMLQPGVTKWTMADGKTVQSAPDAKRGTVMALDAQTHISENVGKTALEAILVEFKKPAPAASAAKKASSTPSCKVVAESPHATAQLCSGAAGSLVSKHTHLASVVYVALTDLNAEITDDAGKMHTMDLKKDAAVIAPPETHSGKNVGKAPYQLIVVDMK